MHDTPQEILLPVEEAGLQPQVTASTSLQTGAYSTNPRSCHVACTVAVPKLCEQEEQCMRANMHNLRRAEAVSNNNIFFYRTHIPRSP